jgi:CO/xanthine dehydrogenase Mo-binding subunit
MNRREFLQASGAFVVSSSLSFEALAEGKPGLVPGELDSWIAVMPDGGVKAFFGKMDMGQGLDVAVAQIVAEELDVGVNRVEVLMGDTATSCNQGGASGSTGVSNGARLLRKAAAEARRVLVEVGAQAIGVHPSYVSVEDGVVTYLPHRKISYAELVGGKYFRHAVQWNGKTGNPMDIEVPAKPKAPAEYKVVGKPVPRRDVAWKVFGTGDFVTDVRVPGMLHARVIRPPRAACKINGVDESSIKGLRGVQVVREKDFVAVVAPREWDAVRAAQQLKVDWHTRDGAFPEMAQLYDHVRAAKVTKRAEEVKRGDVTAAFAKAARIVEAQYEWQSSSACRRTRCMPSGSRGRVPTAAMTRETQPWTRLSCRRRSASRCACRGCAWTAPPGIRRRRPACSAAVPRSTARAKWWPTNSCRRASPASTSPPTSPIPPTAWSGSRPAWRRREL